MTVYLLHFDKPYKHARHYLGYSSKPRARLQAHRSGAGARLMQVLKENGISFTVARIWGTGTWALEKKLKKQKNTPRLCPVCQALRNLPIRGGHACTAFRRGSLSQL